MQAAIEVAAAEGAGQDRALVLPAQGGLLMLVADGAGGSGGGALAAERVLEFFRTLASEASSTDWFDALCACDDELTGHALRGETTAVVAYWQASRLRGASVGDSVAWWISSTGACLDLTVRQRRKPLLGSGEALPVEFETECHDGRLLLASDGLVKYAAADRIQALAQQGSVATAAAALVSSVRLGNGGLHDDVAVVLAGR